MKKETYYCPLCGNRPFAAFIHCKLIEQPICTDCDDVIRQYFQNKVDDQTAPPKEISNLVDCGNLTLDECSDLWHKQQIVTLLRDLRDEISLFDEAGELWDSACVEYLSCYTLELQKLIAICNEQGVHKFKKRNGGNDE